MDLILGPLEVEYVRCGGGERVGGWEFLPSLFDSVVHIQVFD